MCTGPYKHTVSCLLCLYRGSEYVVVGSERRTHACVPFLARYMHMIYYYAVASPPMRPTIWADKRTCDYTICFVEDIP